MKPGSWPRQCGVLRRSGKTINGSICAINCNLVYGNHDIRSGKRKIRKTLITGFTVCEMFSDYKIIQARQKHIVGKNCKWSMSRSVYIVYILLTRYFVLPFSYFKLIWCLVQLHIKISNIAQDFGILKNTEVHAKR